MEGLSKDLPNVEIRALKVLYSRCAKTLTEVSNAMAKIIPVFFICNKIDVQQYVKMEYLLV